MKFPSLLAAVLVSSTVLSDHAFAQVQQPIIELDGGVARNQGFGGLGVFLPYLFDSRNGVFLDASGTLFEGAVRQGSFGLGYRHRLGQDWVLGAYGYYDLLTTSHNNRFNQWSLGVEALGPVYEARANFYLPRSGEDYVAGLSRAFVLGD